MRSKEQIQKDEEATKRGNLLEALGYCGELTSLLSYTIQYDIDDLDNKVELDRLRYNIYACLDNAGIERYSKLYSESYLDGIKSKQK